MPEGERKGLEIRQSQRKCMTVKHDRCLKRKDMLNTLRNDNKKGVSHIYVLKSIYLYVVESRTSLRSAPRPVYQRNQF